MVFQDYALFPHLTVAENVGFGVARKRRAARVAELLALVGLDGLRAPFPARALRRPAAARRARARARARPEIVLLDEPWSNIDPFLRATMRDELARILRGIGVTVVLVTHDREEAFSLADRIALMRDGAHRPGRARPEELYLEPADRWTAEFVGAGNFLPGRVDGDARGDAARALPASRTRRARRRRRTDPPGAARAAIDPNGPGEVVGREFRGHDVFYRVALATGRCSSRSDRRTRSCRSAPACR